MKDSDAADDLLKALVHLINDPSLSDADKMRHLERLRFEIDGFIQLLRGSVGRRQDVERN